MKFFAVAGLLGDEAFGHQEAVGGDAQAGMMVKPSPATPFVVVQAAVLFEVLVVTLDTPALVGDANERVDRHVFRRRRQRVFARLVFLGRPLDEQPLFWVQARAPHIPASMAYPYDREAIAQDLLGPLAPLHGLKRLGGKAKMRIIALEEIAARDGRVQMGA